MTPEQQAAYDRGYDDALHHRSDFVRRGYSFDTGERQAYMRGRFIAAADRLRNRLRDENTARKEN